MHVHSPSRSTDSQSNGSIEWDETNCLLCGGDCYEPLVEAADHAHGEKGLIFLVVQCQECGLCFTNPRPSERWIGQFYGRDYKPHQRRRPLDRTERAFRQRRYKEFVPTPQPGRNRLLEFGCGGGDFLTDMSRIGWEVVGLDFAPRVVEQIREETGLTVAAGTLPHPSLSADTFDCIAMRHSLEHVHDPAQVLSEAFRLLRRGGSISILAPNIDSFAFRTFGHAWFGLDLPRHLTHFTPLTLEVMLTRAGFANCQVRMIRQSSWLRHSVSIARRVSAHRRKFPWLRNRLGSNLVSWYSCLTSQSDSFQITATKAA